jgi:hypothetical protein
MNKFRGWLIAALDRPHWRIKEDSESCRVVRNEVAGRERFLIVARKARFPREQSRVKRGMRYGTNTALEEDKLKVPAGSGSKLLLVAE